jgi:hypothetical protein
MARAALDQIEGQCWQIIIVVAAGIASLVLAVFYGLQQEPEAPKFLELRATPCLRKDYQMAWAAQDFKMDGGSYDATTGLYQDPTEGLTWAGQCPSIVDEQEGTELYENALLAEVKQVCSVSDCEISFLAQFWQQRCRDIEYGTAQRNCEATCIAEGDCLDSPGGGGGGPWFCPAGQAAPACVTRCEVAVQKLGDECFFMRDESSPYYHPIMVRQTLTYLAGSTCASATCTQDELDINMGPLNARHKNRCSYSTFGDLVLNNCERKACLDADADNYNAEGTILGAAGEEVTCITASCPTTLPADIVEQRNLQGEECTAKDLRVAADVATCAASIVPGGADNEAACDSVLTMATCEGIDTSSSNFPCEFTSAPAQCTGTTDGLASCTFSTDVDIANTNTTCGLNADKTACSDDSADCTFSPGNACALNSDSTACAAVNGENGDCAYVPRDTAESDCNTGAGCVYTSAVPLCDYIPAIQCSDTALGDTCQATCKPGFVPAWQYGMGGTASRLTVPTRADDGYSTDATYGPKCTGTADTCATVAGTALETSDACDALPDCTYQPADASRLANELPLRCALDSTWDARSALMCVARPCDENIESNADQRLPNQAAVGSTDGSSSSSWCAGEVGDTCNFECELGYNRVGGQMCTGNPATGTCAFRPPNYAASDCVPRDSALDPVGTADQCEYTASQHVCSEDPLGGARFQGGACEPAPCTGGLEIAGAEEACSGATGDVCVFTCGEEYLHMGEHVCMPDGSFHGGECTDVPCTTDNGVDVDACSLNPPDEDGDGVPDRDCPADSSSSRSGKLAKYAFDGLSSREEIEFQHTQDSRYYYWHSATGSLIEGTAKPYGTVVQNAVTLQYNFETRQAVCSYAITGPVTLETLGPKSWQFQGGQWSLPTCTFEGEVRQNGHVCQMFWYDLDTRTDVQWDEYQRRVFAVPEENWSNANGEGYQYYRLRITDVELERFGVEIAEWEIFPVATMEAVFPVDFQSDRLDEMRDEFSASLGSMLGIPADRIVVALRPGSVVVSFYIKAPALTAPVGEASTVQAYKSLQAQLADPAAVEEAFGESEYLGGVPLAIESSSLAANPCNNIQGLNISSGVHNCTPGSMKSGSFCVLTCDENSVPSGDGIMSCFMGDFEVETCVAEECEMLPGGSQFQIPGATHNCKTRYDNMLQHEDVCQITCANSSRGTPMVPSEGGNISCFSGQLFGVDQVCTDPSCFVLEEVGAESAACTGTADEVAELFDAAANATTPAYTPACDLDINTDGTADCPNGCEYVEAGNGTLVNNLDIENGVHSCPDVMTNGMSCDLNCSVGYAPVGTGIIECVSSQLVPDECAPVDCVEDSSADTDSPGCTCNVGFAGTISWDDATSSWVGACESVPCVDFSSPTATYHDPTVGCGCDTGYSGTIAWSSASQIWTGTCEPNPCTSNSTQVTYQYLDMELEDPEDVEVTIGLAEGTVVESGSQTEAGDAPCERWNPSYRGDITLSCSLGVLQLVVGQGNCTHHNECDADEDNCVSAETLGREAGAQCEHTGPGEHDCICPAGLYGNGVDGAAQGADQATATSCQPCPPNSGGSITGLSDTSRAEDITGCICNSGYTVDQAEPPTQGITSTGDVCAPIPCPENSEGAGAGGECSCIVGYGGSIAWNSQQNLYEGTCAATYCDVALESDPDVDTYYVLENGTHSCGNFTLFNSSCPFTCDEGYIPAGDGVRTCEADRMLEQEGCLPKPCNTTGLVVENAVHDCAATIDHDDSCVAQCDSQYLGSAPDASITATQAQITCQLGIVSADSCVLLECPTDTQRLYNEDGSAGPCTCIPGYIGNVTFDGETNEYDSNCMPAPCNADTPPVTYTHADASITEGSCSPGSNTTAEQCSAGFVAANSTIQGCGAGCTFRAAGQRSGPIGVTDTLQVDSTTVRQCQDWSENFRGTMTLRCQFDEQEATSVLELFADSCTTHDACNTTAGDGADCHSEAICEDTTAQYGPGTHNCICNSGFYGDGFGGANHSGAQGVTDGCTACPEFSSTSQVAEAQRRTDCICDAGYTTGGGSTVISDESHECTAVPCPEFTEGAGAGELCECSAAYTGEIQWNAPAAATESGAYSGTCETICPAGYTFSHAGVFDMSAVDDPFFTSDEEAVAEGQYSTVAECSAMCEGDDGYGCVAFSFVEATGDAVSVCRRYSINGTATEQAGAATCLKELAACAVTAEDSIENGETEGETPAVQPRAAVDATCTGNATDTTQTCDLDDSTDDTAVCPAGCAFTAAVDEVEAVAEVPACGGTVQSGETCALTCDDGYTATLPDAPESNTGAGSMFCYDGTLELQTCNPNPCELSSVTVENGALSTECGAQVAHGAICTLSCDVGFAPSGDGALACTLGAVEQETCDLVACPTSSSGGAGDLCTCDQGYSGEIAWDAVTMDYTGTCTPNPCESVAFVYNGTTINTTITVQSGSSDSVDCSSWHSGYRGPIALECTLGELAVTNATCAAVDLCADAEDDCHSDVSECIHTGPGEHVCQCNTGYWGDGHGTAGCTECPAYSTTSDSTAAVTDCECNSGYYNAATEDQSIETSASTCQPVPCPENSVAENSGDSFVGENQVCTCVGGFAGAVTWNSGANDYDSTCEPICPVGAGAASATCVPSATAADDTVCVMSDPGDVNTCGSDPYVAGACEYVPAVEYSPAYTWSHAGWFSTYSSDSMFADANAQTEAVESVTACADLCGWGCSAFSFVEVNTTSVCYMYSATAAGDQASASSTDSSCIKTVSDCPGSVSIDNRATDETCDATVASGTTCTLTCAAGYQPALAADDAQTAVAGAMYCFDGTLAVQTCEPAMCDMSSEVFDICTGVADPTTPAQAATCTGDATDTDQTCDLDASTDGIATCPDGCTSTAEVVEVAGPQCDLDAGTDATAECAAGCTFIDTTDNCPTELQAGQSSCTLTCPAGYATTTATGSIDCNELSPAGTEVVAPGCTAVPCPDNSAAADDLATCVCFGGYQGTVVWNAATSTYDGTCEPSPCDAGTGGVMFTYDSEATQVSLAMNADREASTQTIAHGGTGDVQCEDWNPNYRGTIGLECSTGALTVVDGTVCSPWDRCSVADDHDCHANADCESTGPGTHSCTCNQPSLYGDGYVNATGCVACPENSAVSDRPTNRSTLVTDCACNVGYTGPIENTSSTCAAVPCPELSSGDGAGGACACDTGYAGTVEFADNAYSSTCAAICPAGYTYSHAGVLGGDLMAPTTVSADQTMESCATLCDTTGFCLAYSYSATCTIGGTDSAGCCSLFDVTTGAQNGPADGTAHSCLRTVVPCSADLSIQNGANDCGDAVESGATCTLNCDPGYTESGSGDIACFNGNLAGADQRCVESACDGPAQVDNSADVCDTPVDSGDPCAVTCDTGFSVPATTATCVPPADGTTDCTTGYAGNATSCPTGCTFTAGTARSATGAMECLRGELSALTCTADPCSIDASRVENTESHNCGTQIDSNSTCDFTCAPGFRVALGTTGGTIECYASATTTTGSCAEVSCPDNAGGGGGDECTCDDGYMGTIAWDSTTGEYTGSCVPSACTNTTTAVSWTFDNTEGEVSLADGTEIASGTAGTASCQQWNPNYRGQIDMQCSNGALAVDEDANCTAFDVCAANEDDCHADAICESLPASQHSCTCDTGYGDGTDCVACPMNSAVSDRPTDRASLVTDCACNVGYTGPIENTSSMCAAVPCPELSSGDGAGSACACDTGYAGTVEFADNAYSSNACAAICPAGYTYSHAGVLGGDATVVPATGPEAGYTMASCGTLCEGTRFCLAFTVSSIDSDTNEGTCTMYTSSGVQTTEVSAHTCDRIVEPCGNATVADGTHDCVSADSPSVASGATCNLVCNDGYTQNDELTCFDTEYSSPTCSPSSCDVPADLAISNGGHDCTGTIAHGDACTTTCNSGYSFSGDGSLLCTLGVLEVETCEPDPCGDRAATCVPSATAAEGTECAMATPGDPNTCGNTGVFDATACVSTPAVVVPTVENGQHDCTYPVASGTSCTLTCEAGYTASNGGQIACSAGTLALETCSSVSCPENSELDSSGACTCDSGYGGTVSFAAGGWNGTCSALPCVGAADGVDATTREYTAGTVTGTFQLANGTEVAADGTTNSYDCSLWNADFYGTIEAVCGVGPAFSISSDQCSYINACIGDNTCAADATCDSTAPADCAAADPPDCSAHSCYCGTNSYGDGIAGGTACTACPANAVSSAGSSVSPDSNRLVTDCTCSIGYTVDSTDANNPQVISSSADSCTAVPCPENSNGDGASGACECDPGFYGSVTWSDTANAYTSTCTAACTDGYNFLVNGRITDNRVSNASPDPVFTAAAGYPVADQTLAQCAALCTTTSLCVAFTSFAGGSPDESAPTRQGDCALYSSTDYNNAVSTTVVCDTTPVCTDGTCAGELSPDGCDTISVATTTFQPTCVAEDCVCGDAAGQLDCGVSFFTAGTAASNDCDGTIIPGSTCGFQCAPGFTAGGEHVAPAAEVAATCEGTAAASCYGTADPTTPAQAATCTGNATDTAQTCDLDASTDGIATCPDGCTSTAEVVEVAGPTCDLDAGTDATAECAAGCTGVNASYVSKFTIQYSDDATTWASVRVCNVGICTITEFIGTATAQEVVLSDPITARYVRIVPTADGLVGSATISGSILTCGDRTDGLCAYDVQTYGGAQTTLADVFADADDASWTSFPGAAQTSLSTEVVGTTQAVQEAQFVRVTTDCTGVVSIAELELIAQACNCDPDPDPDVDAPLFVWATDGAGACASGDAGR